MEPAGPAAPMRSSWAALVWSCMTTRRPGTARGRGSLSAPANRAMLDGQPQSDQGRPAMAGETYDRTTQDVGNIVALEHVNVMIADQQLATLFYVVGLGLTRDPYLMPGLENMWINIGQQQFHLPTNKPQVLRGHVGLVISGYEELPARLEAVKPRLA